MSHDGISKDQKNEQQGYSFRGIDQIYNSLSAVLAGADLCILPRMMSRSQEERTTKTGGCLFYVTVHAEFDFVSARDGSKHTVSTFGEAMDSADKATNKAMSAAYKYACLQTFVIPTEGMEDADATTHEPQPKKKTEKPAPAPKPAPTPIDKPKPAAPATDKPVVTLDMVLASFVKPANITNAFLRLRGHFLPVLPQDKWDSILAAHNMKSCDDFKTLENAKKCFAAAWGELQAAKPPEESE
jgi:hypothetical protein